jgi:c(7)-type cytochrome triheme protein
MKFDHARHTRMGGDGCATCHRPARAGVAMTIPTGTNAHVTCYQCHGPQAKSGDKQISSCATCHELGRFVRTREVAQAFRVSFSHAKHNKDEGLGCNDCHRVRAGATQPFQVTAPQPLNHHAPPGASSCMSCHNGRRAFGGDDFSVCTRCHTKATWHF